MALVHELRAAQAARAAQNRLNAQKSTGPRTPEGKRKSSRNALKHGLCSESPLLPHEDAATFNTIRREFEEDLKPTTTTQILLCDRITHLSMRLMRIQEAENKLFMEETEKLCDRDDFHPTPPAPGTPEADNWVKIAPCQVLAEAFSNNPTSNPFVLLRRYETSFSREMSRLLDQYMKLKKNPFKDPAEPLRPHYTPAWTPPQPSRDRSTGGSPVICDHDLSPANPISERTQLDPDPAPHSPPDPSTTPSCLRACVPSSLPPISERTHSAPHSPPDPSITTSCLRAFVPSSLPSSACVPSCLSSPASVPSSLPTTLSPSADSISKRTHPPVPQPQSRVDCSAFAGRDS